MMKKLSLICVYLLSVSLFALEYSVSVTPNAGVVGDIFKYELTVLYNANESLISVPDTSLFQEFSIQDKSFHKDVQGDVKTLTFSVDFQAFSIEDLVVPTQTITYKDKQTKKITIAPIHIPIQSLMSTENGTLEVDPLKPLPSMSLNRNAVVVLLGSVLAVLLICFGLWKRLQKRHKQEYKEMVVVDERTPQEKAIEALDRLPSKGYIQAKLYKAFYTELCEILKLFISESLDINVVDMTTEETMSTIASSIDEQTLRRLKHVLDFSDLVKFAKFDASESLHDDYVSKAKDVVLRMNSNEA